DDIAAIESGLADSVRLIADEVRTNVQAAMKSLRADLAAAARAERPSGAAAEDARSGAKNARLAAREQLQRAEAAIADFRGGVRGDLRAHVARGGELPAALVDELTATLARAAEAVKTGLGQR